MEKRQPSHRSLMRTVLTVTGKDSESVSNALLVLNLTAHVLPAENLAEVLQVVNKQLRSLEGKFAEEASCLLEKAKAHILEQVRNLTNPNADMIPDLEGILNSTKPDSYVGPMHGNYAEIA